MFLKYYNNLSDVALFQNEQFLPASVWIVLYKRALLNLNTEGTIQCY